MVLQSSQIIQFAKCITITSCLSTAVFNRKFCPQHIFLLLNPINNNNQEFNIKPSTISFVILRPPHLLHLAILLLHMLLERRSLQNWCVWSTLVLRPIKLLLRLEGKLFTLVHLLLRSKLLGLLTIVVQLPNWCRWSYNAMWGLWPG